MSAVSRVASFFVGLCIVFSGQVTTYAICPGGWQPGEPVPGVSGGSVLAVQSWDDGGGLAMFVAGSFRVAGNLPVNTIAKHSGTTWSTLGTGLTGGSNPTVRSMAVFNNELVVSGVFSNAGGTSVLNVARWNGSSWSAMGGLSINTKALCAYNGELYAGDSGTDGMGNGLAKVMRWDGTSWVQIAGFSTNSPSIAGMISAMVVHQGQLHVAGTFAGSTPSGPSANIRRFDGTNWTSLGLGLNNTVVSLASHGTDLVAGGFFSTIVGGGSASRVAKWDGSAWSALGAGSGSNVNNVISWNGELYATGNIGTNNIARWNGSSWLSLAGQNTSSETTTLGVHGSQLVIGASHYPSRAAGLALWDGTSWTRVAGTGQEIDGALESATLYGGDLVVSGSFTQIAATPVNRIARWNGSTWNGLGTGFTSGNVYDMLEHNSDLVICGGFLNIGGTPANNIARWDGSAWHAYGTGLSGGFGANAVAIYHNTLYAAGDFTGRFKRWDGSTWTTIAGGPNDQVRALAVHNDELILGGNFTIVNGGSANRIVRYHDVNGWSTFGTGANQPVYALHVVGGDLIAGGQFTNMNGTTVARVARYSGGTWSAMGTNIVGGPVTGFTTYQGDLIAFGALALTSVSPNPNVASWNGTTWTAVDGGVRHPPPYNPSSTVEATAALEHGGLLYVGGRFSAAGNQVSPFLARFACAPPPTGACCLPAGNCQILTSAACATAGGTYRGDLTNCPATPGCGSEGDTNGNGTLDASDITCFMQCITGPPPAPPCNCAVADIDGDGDVDIDDIDEFVCILIGAGPPCP